MDLTLGICRNYLSRSLVFVLGCLPNHFAPVKHYPTERNRLNVNVILNVV